ncbi:hypothetical protein CK623_04375 [Vandammella animalimorsus]|uniref:FHA domain-containing protein n=1 Tax=Vandammella animalimorsus TaxID=2029117 RepID=A0A2A2ASB1_9BURK|nr:hypothetical protein [Vandammella animalimorsus]PAT40618.1 hypothetical protein CK623_04375 [Vandammella animalimorsus]
MLSHKKSKKEQRQSVRQAPASQAMSYVVSETLNGLKNIFDVGAVWGSSGFFKHGASGLRGLLERHTFDDGKVFSQVIVELPHLRLCEDMLHQGQLRRRLQASLTKLHQEQLGARSAGDVRYTIASAADLCEDQVRVRMGHAIHVPADGERAAWRIEISSDGGLHWSPFEVFEGQRYVLLGRSEDHATFAYPDWPFGEGLFVLLANDQAQEPPPPHFISLRNTLTCHAEQALKAVRVSASIEPTTLLIRCERLLPAHVTAAPAAPAVIETASTHQRAPARHGDVSREETIVAPPAATSHSPTLFDGTLVLPLPGQTPQTAAQLRLSGIALQRLSPYVPAGIRHFSFGLDAIGRITLPGSPQAHCRLNVDAEADTVTVTVGHDNSKILTPGQRWLLPDGSLAAFLAFDDQALQALYLGWLPLERGPRIDLLPEHPLLLGRGSVDTAVLQAFAKPGFLVGTRPLSGDCLGISSPHLRLVLEPEAEHLLVESKGRSPTYVLNPDLSLKTEVTSQGEHALRHGEKLLLGHYVLEFSSTGKP